MYNTIYPGYVQSYYNINQRQIQKKQDEEKNSQSSQNAENDTRDASGQNRQEAGNAQFLPNGEKFSIDYTRNKIGIDQILSDFRKTTAAIGVPEEINQEVSSYFALIESQAQKENPNEQIIQANLKNASKILDEYITNALKKPSKVVEEWVDTLFLNSIDYKTQKSETPDTVTVVQEEPQPQFEQVEIQTAQEEQIPVETQVEAVEQTPVPEEALPQIQAEKTDIYVPEDQRLKRLFLQAKKYAAIDNKEHALYSFQNAMDYAEEIGDEQTQAMIHFEEGKLYYEFDRPEDALYNYAISALQTEDNNLRARAYLSMGKIYDDYVNFEPAIDHYAAAVSYAGEADNLKIQSKALSDLAQIHAGRYDRDNANMFMKLAAITAQSSEDDRVKGIIYAKNARMQDRLGEKARALTSYSTSTEAFANLEDNENLAKNYREAAMIMRGYGNYSKSQTLLNKAYYAAQKTDNQELKLLILQDMEAV